MLLTTLQVTDTSLEMPRALPYRKPVTGRHSCNTGDRLPGSGNAAEAPHTVGHLPNRESHDQPPLTEWTSTVRCDRPFKGRSRP